ncbi:alpha/beta hydrolase [Mucilaginibacter pallidiroseus]|uniref:Alpha/beta hydrolase n=1 Tax=Mucilaginibacter pallidiroseus TaxID=2599295 RepID=A0A563UD03_9SPHI|nr:alpha/beta hydrolase [Mucilaginibacter pallidiroseus]TWR29210.1 alpha/beta hydrolase [Mucilaginibacter pallidiroseus]
MKKNFINSTALAAMLLAAACSGDAKKTAADSTGADTAAIVADTAAELKPAGPAPAWAPSMKPEMQVVIEKLASYGDKPIPQLTAVEARKNHTPTDAVMDVMKEHGIAKPAFKVDTMGKDIPVNGGDIHVRVYTPQTGKSSYPVIVYYHGGGFVIANLDVYDASPNALAQMTDAVVVSVAYRLAPENKFPVAHNDAFDAYKWVVANASSIKGDPKKIAVAGESAGGNLAVATAIKARDSKVMLPTAILAVYPVAQSDMNTASYVKNAAAKPLDKPMMAWFVKNYLNSMAEAKDPRISLVSANLKGLPATTIITAEIDPLQSDGMMLADKLKAAGVTVDSKNWDGVTHEFFGMGAVVPQAKEAEQYAADQLKKAFGM